MDIGISYYFIWKEKIKCYYIINFLFFLFEMFYSEEYLKKDDE